MNSKILIAAAAATLAVSLSAGGAKAITSEPPADVFFTITSDTNATITFETLESPTPSSFLPGIRFELDGIPITVGGVPDGTDDFLFFNASSGGGLNETNGFFGGEGIFASQLYSGPESAPTFIPGTYAGTYTIEADPDATITISTSATPLPSTWTMLIAGFVGLGFFAYRGSKKNVAALTAA